MRLEKLYLTNFKNYASAEVVLKGNIHCLLGKNGSGKTNLLDAIHYLSMTRGAVHSHDPSSIREGETFFSIRGDFEKGGKSAGVLVSYVLPKKKTVASDGKEYQRFSEHIGKYPMVLVAPNDVDVISGGGEARRRFFDTLLSQVDPSYLQQLIVYQAQLRQRNGLLRIFAERGSRDADLIATYDEKLVSSGLLIYAKRKEFIRTFLTDVQARYNFLTKGSREAISMEYASEVGQLDFAKELINRLDQDIVLGRTTVGIHRDDFLFTLAGRELKRFGSQGQQKSFLVAIKLAEFDCLHRTIGEKPLLLLDDIFDKLDDARIHQLITLMSEGDFGQVFITDARPERSLEVLKQAGLTSQNFLVEEGAVKIW